MKKVIAVSVILSILLSLGIVMPAAVEVSGDWIVYRQANDYPEVDPDSSEQPSYKPAPGYEYTNEGFTTIPADYTGTNPYFNVQTKDKQNIKEGIYLKFRVDDFSYKGKTGNADEWIALSLWDRENLAPGQLDYGSGMICLIRGDGADGAVKASPYLTRMNTETTPGTWKGAGSESIITPEKDGQGREIYTLEIEWVNGAYRISVCGVALNGGDAITELLESLNEYGDFYVGVSFYSGEKDGTAAMTILEYGTSKDNASVPVGNDSKEPEENVNIVADMMDASLIGTNQPALYFDAAHYTVQDTSNIRLTPMGDNSFHAEVAANPSFFSWNIKRNTSYAVEDFPILAIMVKEFWGNGILWYQCGDIINPTTGKTVKFDAFTDGKFFSGEGFEDYTLILIDLNDLGSGRINGFRVDIHGVDLSFPEFEINYMGCFRSTDEATAYAEQYLGTSTGKENDTEEATNSVTDDNAGEDTGDLDTDAITNEPGSNTMVDGQTNGSGGDGGCQSVIGLSMISLIGLGALLLSKKKE